MTPHAYLTDWIERPEPGDMVSVRRMVLRVTNRVADLERKADLNEQVNAALERLAALCEAPPDLLALYEAQEDARRVLGECARAGRM